MTRVTSIESGAVVITGLVNLRRFESRTGEHLVLGDLLDKSISIVKGGTAVVAEDLGMESYRTGDWFITQVHVMMRRKGIRRKSITSTLAWEDVQGFETPETDQSTSRFLATMNNLRAADLAAVIQDLTPHRRVEVARELDDERLADVLEEMDEVERVALLTELEGERAADVLGEMDPDDAADLLHEVGAERAQQLIDLMEPEDAEDVLRLMNYEDYSAGGMMTTEPLIMSADYTVADALAVVRRSDISPALASQVFVTRQPLETPTGRFIGMVHYQRLLREPPATLLGSLVDTDTQGLSPEATLNEVSTYLASYNLLSVPVVDGNQRLLGAVTVDDVLDHLLPDNWRVDHRDNTRTDLESITSEVKGKV
jgi:Mg/Co/Ni transporter MgtE